MASPCVIKIGSANLVDERGALDSARLLDYARQIHQLQQVGHKVVLVSSGAVAAGSSQLTLKHSFTGHRKQLLAALGQPRLMSVYQAIFQQFSLSVAQVLLVREDLDNRRLYLNARETLQGLLAHDVLPIVNENDVVTAGSFGGNDQLAAAVAGLVDASTLIILTNVDGIYEEDPRQNPQASKLDTLPLADIASWQARFSGGKASSLGTGGIETKLSAARIAGEFGIPTIIADGAQQEILPRLIENNERVGTRIEPSLTPLEARKRWLLFGIQPRGKLTLDAGAVQALQNRGSSLLAVGIAQCEGKFERGDAVEILDPAGNRIGVGLTNYDSILLPEVLGKPTAEIQSLYGDAMKQEVVHRDHFVLG